MVFQTEIEFALPKGYLDAGRRPSPATASCAWRPRRTNPAAEGPARAAERGLSDGHRARAGDHAAGLAAGRRHQVIEGLFASDLDYLQALYERLNGDDDETAAGRLNGGADQRSIAWDGRFGVAGGSMKAYPVASALRGDGLHRLPLPLDPRRADGARTCRAPPLVPRDLGDQPAARTATPQIRSRSSE